MSVTFNQKPLVAPSILSADFTHLGKALQDLEAAKADWIHIDVMDGHFVPNLTFGPPVIKALKKHSKLPFDVHLMIESPEQSVKDYVDAGADIVTIHAEATNHLQRHLRQIKDLGAKAGVSLNPATPIDCLNYVLDDLDLILIMSVNPGFGGQQFIPTTLQKLQDVKRLVGDRPIWISVDGGITPQNAQEVRSCGAQVLVAGSAVFNSSSPMAQVVQQLR